MDTSTHLLNVTEAAKWLGLSVSGLAKMRMSGAGPEFLKLGRRVLYHPDALAAWTRSLSRCVTSR